MQIEGRLKIALSTRDGRVIRVEISSSRPVRAARVFTGKSPAEVLKTLPLLFSVCGTAQACAAVRAIEQAQGKAVMAGIEALRDQLVRLETIREHCLKISQDWPDFSGRAPDLPGLREILFLQRAIANVLVGDTRAFMQGSPPDLPQPGTVEAMLARLHELLGTTILGISPKAWLRLDDMDALSAWAGKEDNPAAALVQAIMQRNWEKLGCTSTRPLPSLRPDAMLKALMDDDFEMQPTWSGECRETSSLTRTHSPLLESLLALHGNGLLSRLIARLTELAQFAVNLQQVTGDFHNVSLESTPLSPHNPGIGQVAAARGQLVHQVTLEQNRIRDYRIVAPTEWNFHPQGVMRQSLLGLSGNLAEVEKQARLLINAVDPCVAYDLSVN